MLKLCEALVDFGPRACGRKCLVRTILNSVDVIVNSLVFLTFCCVKPLGAGREPEAKPAPASGNLTFMYNKGLSGTILVPY